MLSWLKNYFNVWGKNKKLKEELFMQQVLNNYLNKCVIELEIRNNDVVLICMNHLLKCKNNEDFVPASFMESGKFEDLTVKYEIRENGDINYWLETHNAD